ncbi:MAG: glutamine synthetase [Planctomycetota bacterium]|nr:MAG: glutamine synthetase [Planctomycetota bacterium]
METQAMLQAVEEAGKVKLGAFDIDAVLRGKYVSAAKFRSALEKGLGFCDVVFGWDMADQLYDNVTYTGWHTGYPDAWARVEPSTFRRIPWEQGTPFVLLDFYEASGEPLAVSPRQALRRVVERARGMGYEVKAGFEFEFFFFQEDHHTLHEAEFRDLVPLSYGMFGYSATRTSRDQGLVHQLFDELRAFDVGLEGFHTETGPGVYEAAIACDEAVAAADKAALFKQAVKEIAAQHGCTATFMAKPDAKLPGCSGHVHQSLADAAGKNLFAGEEGGLSPLARSYVAGQVRYMPELTALFAPTINSYKRLVPGAWAPTHASWGLENRTCALRAITGPSAKSVRVEYRAAGADQNPYLALCAGVISGLAGIGEGLEPPPPVTGNAYELSTQQAPRLPSNLGAAAEAFAGSALAREWLGEAFVEHYANTRRWEVREFEKAVTDWELRRYLEVI